MAQRTDLLVCLCKYTTSPEGLLSCYSAISPPLQANLRPGYELITESNLIAQTTVFPQFIQIK